MTGVLGRSGSELRRLVSVAAALVLLAGVIAAGQPVGDDEAASPGGGRLVDAGSETPSGSDLDGVLAPAGRGTSTSAPAGSPSQAAASGGAPAGGTEAAVPAGTSTAADPDKPPVKIGIPWSDTTGANAALIAVTGSAGFQGAQKVQAEAVVAHMNANGGLNGHPIEPVFHQIDVAQYVTKEGRTREGQRMCAAFTEDAEVFAIVSAAVSMPENIMVECAYGSQTPLVMSKPDGMAYLSEARASEVAGYVYWPGGMTAERRERTVVEGLVSQGVLTREARIGILYQDDPYIREGVERGLEPALRAHGIEPVAEAAYPDIIESPWQSYVLAFQSQDVDVVLWAATTGSVLPVLLFMRAAEGQGYRPTYGLGTDEVPAGLPALGAPEEQLSRVHLVGWSAYHDTLELEPVSPNDERCRSIMRDIGQPELTNQNGGCEALFFLAQALQGADALTPASLANGVARLGGSFASVWVGGTQFEGSVRDGVATVRDGRFDREDCGCFRYTSGPRPAA